MIDILKSLSFVIRRTYHEETDKVLNILTIPRSADSEEMVFELLLPF